jgi:hypothetical protein
MLAAAGADLYFATEAGAAGGAFLAGAVGGTTALMAAAGAGWGNAQDRRGRNLIGLAYQDDGRSLETVRLIVTLAEARGRKEAVLSATDATGQTALHAAATRRLDDVVRFLVESGADINARDGRGRSALDLARSTEGGAPSTVALLRSLGAADGAEGSPR